MPGTEREQHAAIHILTMNLIEKSEVTDESGYICDILRHTQIDTIIDVINVDIETLK